MHHVLTEQHTDSSELNTFPVALVLSHILRNVFLFIERILLLVELQLIYMGARVKGSLLEYKQSGHNPELLTSQNAASDDGKDQRELTFITLKWLKWCEGKSRIKEKQKILAIST